MPINPMPPASPSPMNAEHKKVGPIIATLIIVLVLIIAALYLFASRLNQQAIPTDDTADQYGASATTTTVQPVTNKADDVQSIQSDLNSSTNGLGSQGY